jgi:hypothetical protein
MARVRVPRKSTSRSENAKPLGALAGRAIVFGTLRPDEAFYNFTAVSIDGTECVATGIVPSINWDMSEGRAVIAHGQLQSLTVNMMRPQPNHYLGLYFFREYRVPLYEMSEAEEHGEKYLILDTAKFEACGAHFTVKVREGTGMTLVQATSETPFSTGFHLRIREALQYITGKTAACRARLESNDVGLAFELISPTRTANHTQFVAPISRASQGFYRDVWKLFSVYLAYLTHKTEHTYWHPIAYHLYNACESSANSLDAWAVGVSVAVEAVASLIPLQSDEDEEKRISTLQKLMRGHLKTLSEFVDLSPRMTGLIDMLAKKRPQDVMHALAEKGFVEKSYISAWTKLRNRHVHPTIDDLKKPSQVNYQQLIDRIHCVEVLLYQLIFHLIGYEGLYTDYGIKGFPDKSYPLVAAT